MTKRNKSRPKQRPIVLVDEYDNRICRCPKCGYTIRRK